VHVRDCGTWTFAPRKASGGGRAPRRIAAREVLVEELADRVHSPAPRDLRHVGRGLDAEVADAALREVAEHDAVVAPDLRDERIIRPDVAARARTRPNPAKWRCIQAEVEEKKA